MGAPASTPATGGFGATAPSAPVVEEPSLDMECALLGFTQVQRQLAAECLFYLAYHTQLTADEVAEQKQRLAG